MKIFKELLTIKKRDIIFYFINTIFIVIFYYLLFENSESLYPILVSSLIFFIYIIIEFINYRKFKNILNESIKSPNYRNENANKLEENIIDGINEIHAKYQKELNSLKNDNSRKKEFISTSIHNIKTSVSVISCATDVCNQEILKDDKIKFYINDIEEENKLIQKRLDECLNIIRLDDFFRDYIPKSFNLDMLVKKVINSKKRDFIYAKIFPIIEIDKNIKINTDEKWFSYMIEQILSNSIKYSDKGGKIEISAKYKNESVVLSIKDYGIGIKKDDIQRVFEPFFTGENGREDRNSTGIGLHMVNMIAKSLGHGVRISSEQGRWTEVCISVDEQTDIFDF